jgi:hypothetical protein
MRILRLIAAPTVLVLLVAGSAGAQRVASPPLWYARAGASVARVDGGQYGQRALVGPYIAIGREFGERPVVRALLELQSDWLTHPADDPFCAVPESGEACFLPVPNLQLVTLRGGAVVRRGRWHVAASAGPSLIVTESAGQHGGLSGRVELVALASRNLGIALGLETTRLRSLQSRTLWIPRGGVAIRVSR